MAPKVGAVGRSIGLPCLSITTASPCTNACASATPSTAGDLSNHVGRQAVATLEAEEPLHRVRRLHVAVDAFEHIGEQRVERALDRVAKDERAAEERGAGHDGERRQHDVPEASPNAAQGKTDHGLNRRSCRGDRLDDVDLGGPTSGE